MRTCCAGVLEKRYRQKRVSPSYGEGEGLRFFSEKLIVAVAWSQSYPSDLAMAPSRAPEMSASLHDKFGPSALSEILEARVLLTHLREVQVVPLALLET